MHRAPKDLAPVMRICQPKYGMGHMRRELLFIYTIIYICMVDMSQCIPQTQTALLACYEEAGVIAPSSMENQKPQHPWIKRQSFPKNAIRPRSNVAIT